MAAVRAAAAHETDRHEVPREPLARPPRDPRAGGTRCAPPGERIATVPLPPTWRGGPNTKRGLHTADPAGRCRLDITVAAGFASQHATPDAQVLSRLPDEFPSSLITEGGGNLSGNVSTAWRVSRRHSRPLLLVAIWSGSFPSASAVAPTSPQTLQELRVDLKDRRDHGCRTRYYHTGRLATELIRVLSGVRFKTVHCR